MNLITPFAIINIILALFGIYRAYIKRSLVILPWIILFYLSITSAIVCIGDGAYDYGTQTVMVYLVNWFSCTVSFLIADFLFNRNVKEVVNLKGISSWNLALPIEILFWLSFIVTAVILRNQDYTTYVNGGGAHTWQNIFQFACFIVFYFMYKRQWVKVVISSVLMIAVIFFTPVRSLLFFIAMPILVFALYYYLFNTKSFKVFFLRFIPIILVGFFAAGLLSDIRFGLIRLPETELTRISLDVISYYSYGESIPLHYFNSWQHFFDGLLAPVYSASNLMGIDIRPQLDPSIPLINASINRGVSDVLYVGEMGHNPGTIMHDFLFSFGSFAFIEAFVYYFFLLKLCDYVQRNEYSLMIFSSLFGWHIYMMMRGAVDNACSGIAYSIWYVFIFYFILKLGLRKNNSIYNENLINLNSAAF